MKKGLFKYFLLAAVVQTVWGLTPSASKIVLKYLPVEGYSAIRYTVSGLIFLAYSLLKNGRLSARISDLPKLGLIGILAYAVDSLGTLYGLKIGGVLNFALASSMNAIITAGVAILVLREQINKRIWIAALLSIGGGLALFLGKYDVSTLEIAAGSLLLIWGAYVFEALGFVFSKKYKERMPLTEYIALLQISAAIFMWSLSFATGRFPVNVLRMPTAGWVSLMFVCLISCCACYFLLYWLLNHIEGHKLAFFDCFHTIAAAVFGAALFGEPFNIKMLIGGGLLLSAVIVVTRMGQSHDNEKLVPVFEPEPISGKVVI